MAIYRDSVGNTYTQLPAKKPNKGSKGAKPGPKHGRKSRYNGTKKKHGGNTGRNGPASRLRYFGEPAVRESALSALFAARTNVPRGLSKSQNRISEPPLLRGSK